MRRMVYSFLLVSLLLCPALSGQDKTDSPGFPDSPGDGPVYVIPVNQDIDPFLAVFLKRSLAQAREAGASLVIFEFNTFGGRVDSALEITSLIGSADWARTVAYIPSASGGTGVSWSAGALIAFSCDQIIMNRGTSIGAAAPVYQSPEGMVMAEEKTVSALRGQMAALAEKNGYPRDVALAMVDDDVILFEVETPEGLRLKTPDEIEEMERLTQKEVVRGKKITDKDKLLTLTAGEMEKYAVSSGTVRNEDHLFDMLSLGETEKIRVEQTRSDWLLALLSSGAATSFFIMIGFVALYMEVTSPGFGVPGTVALICFAVVFSLSVMMGNLGSLELLLFLLGLILLLVEIFVIPGFGITGIGGILLILFSLVLVRQDFVFPEFDWQRELFMSNLLYVSISLAGAMALIGLLMALLPQSRLFNRLVLENPSHPPDPDRESSGVEALPGEGQATPEETGQKGVALTDLRPVGKADFDGTTREVQTEGEYLERGREIIVLRKEGLRLVVKGV